MYVIGVTRQTSLYHHAVNDTTSGGDLGFTDFVGSESYNAHVLWRWLEK